MSSKDNSHFKYDHKHLSKIYLDKHKVKEQLVQTNIISDRLVKISANRNVVKPEISNSDLWDGNNSITKHSKLTYGNLESPLRSRRDFLKVATIGLTSGVIFSCKEEDIQIGLLDSYILEGPSKITISKWAGSVKAKFSVQDSTGLDVPAWKLSTPCYFVKSHKHVGPDFEYEFATPGLHNLKLYADSFSDQVLTEKQIEVILSDSKPIKKSDIPLFFVGRDTPIGAPPGTTFIYSLYAMDSITQEISKLFSSKLLYNDSVSPSPNGDKVCLTVAPPEQKYPENPYKIGIYDLATGQLSIVSNNDEGLAWKSKWSPTGEWIAYTDDSEALSIRGGELQKRGFDELSFVRPDGSDHFRLRGEGNDDYIIKEGPKFAAFEFGWDPTGNSIALEAGWRSEWKINILSNLFNGPESVERIMLPTDEQLDRFYNRNNLMAYISKDDFMNTYSPGSNSITWSPDGEYLAYTFQYGYGALGYYWFNSIAVSRADGTGNIVELMVHSGKGGIDPVKLILSPTWSYDGNIYFVSGEVYNYDLYKVDFNNGEPTAPEKIDVGEINVQSVKSLV